MSCALRPQQQREIAMPSMLAHARDTLFASLFAGATFVGGVAIAQMPSMPTTPSIPSGPSLPGMKVEVQPLPDASTPSTDEEKKGTLAVPSNDLGRVEPSAGAPSATSMPQSVIPGGPAAMPGAPSVPSAPPMPSR